jgi:hypothetical protein
MRDVAERRASAAAGSRGYVICRPPTGEDVVALLDVCG